MKRLTSTLIVSLLCAASALAQTYPYQKVMDAEPLELRGQNFRFAKDKNQYILSRTSFGSVLSSIATEADMHGKDDYTITVQLGEQSMKSWMKVEFYDSSIYDTILEFARTNGEGLSDNSTGKGVKYTYTYDGKKFTLAFEKVEVKVTDSQSFSGEKNTSGALDAIIGTATTATTSDRSYDKYVYTVETDVPATSPYLDREKAKNERRRANGQKSTSSAAFL